MGIVAKIVSPVCFVLAAGAFAATPASAQSAATSFFLTSTGIGNGGKPTDAASRPHQFAAKQ